jgi:anti-sigma regulatory factor (Ser/Thr protein kinase)
MADETAGGIREQEALTAPLTQPCSRDFPGDIEAAAEAEAWLASQSIALGLGADTEFAINLCVEELFLNAVQHGHAKRATISIWNEPDGVRLEFVDDGGPFDPSDVSVNRGSGRAGDLEIGGFGVGLVKKFSRRLSYRRSGGYNRLLLEFGAARDANAGTEAPHTT